MSAVGNGRWTEDRAQVNGRPRRYVEGTLMADLQDGVRSVAGRSP